MAFGVIASNARSSTPVLAPSRKIGRHINIFLPESNAGHAEFESCRTAARQRLDGLSAELGAGSRLLRGKRPSHFPELRHSHVDEGRLRRLGRHTLWSIPVENGSRTGKTPH